MNGFTALLLAQGFLKISARTPIGKNRLMVLALRICQGRLLLQQIAEQNRLLRIGFLLVPQFLGLGVTEGLCDCEVRTRFSEMSKVRIHINKNLFTCVFYRECRLLLCQGSLSNLMALFSPIPWLPSKQGANGANVLRQKIDICRTDVACLDGNIRDVMRLLGPGRKLSLAHTIRRQLHFWTMFERSCSGCGK